MTTTSLHEPVEHDTAGIGAVVAEGVILIGFAIGAAFALAQLVDLASWVTQG